MTLLAYQVKKSRVESSSDSESDSYDSPGKSDEDDSDSHDTAAGLSKTISTVSEDETAMYQDNHITVDKPSGSMTIIINNRPSESASASTSQFSSTRLPVPQVPVPPLLALSLQYPLIS